MVRRAKSWAWLLLWGISLLGCDRKDPAEKIEPSATSPKSAPDGADNNPKPATGAEPLASSGSDRMAKVKLDADGKAAAQAKRAEFGRALNAGRKLVKAGKLDAGIAEYRLALAIDPVSPKVLGELGYAALQKGDLELAEGSTRRAIDLSRDPRQQGALYYNLGRVEEKRSDPFAARAAYERSLAARPGNATVQKRLAELKVDPALRGPASPEDLCDEIRTEWECVADEAALSALPEEEAEYMGVCECKISQREDAPTADSKVRAAAIITVEGMAGVGGTIDADYLAVETSGYGWQLVELVANRWNPGVFGISNDGEVLALVFSDEATRAGHELILNARNSLVDTNMGSNTVEFDDSTSTVVCFSEQMGATCARFATGQSSGVEVLFDDEPVEPGEELGESRWAVRLEFDDGQVEVAVAGSASEVPPAMRALVGTHGFDDAVASSAASRIQLH